MTDTTTNQKCSGAGKKRMERRDVREQEQDANAPCLRARRRERGGDVSASSMITWYFWPWRPSPWPQYNHDGVQNSGRAGPNIDK